MLTRWVFAQWVTKCTCACVCVCMCAHALIKTHGSVSCGPRKRGTHKQSEYIDRNNKVAIFTHP